MSVADKMLKEIVTLAKKLATQEHENKQLWSSNMQLKQVCDSKAEQLRETEQELERLQDQLANAQRELSEQGQAHSVELQQETADLRQQLAAAQAAVILQRAGIERLQAFVGMVRELLSIPLAQISYSDMSIVRAELAALDDEPTPVAEPTPCPECEPLQAEIKRLRRFVGGVEGALGAFQSISPDTCCDQIARCLSELEDSPTPVAEPLDAEGGK